MTKDPHHEDQKDVAAAATCKLQEWLTCAQSGNTTNCAPLRLAVCCGEAGSGKTALISALVTLTCQLAGTKKSARVCGPACSAAFNAGGLTCQKLFHVLLLSDGVNMSAASLKSLMQKLTDTAAIIVDERSALVSARVPGMMEQRSRQAAFNSSNCQRDWGGAPIILAIGDDCQLPSIDVMKGDFLFWKQT